VFVFRRMTGPHLDDPAFAELWANALADRTAPDTHQHLQACAECRLRFTSFSNWMEQVRFDAVSEAEDVMSSDRLAAQQAQIARRLEALEHPARVIAFPKHQAGVMRPSPVRLWVAAAAAAGLLVGVGLGQMLDLRHPADGRSTFPADRIADAAPRSTAADPDIVPAVSLLSDEATLEELEDAATPQYEALRAYDTFTPRAADFVQPR
jgi:hypothetical protein